MFKKTFYWHALTVLTLVISLCRRENHGGFGHFFQDQKLLFSTMIWTPFPVTKNSKKNQLFFDTQNLVLKNIQWYTTGYWHWTFFLDLWTRLMLEMSLTKLWEIQIDFPKHFQVVWMFLFDIPAFITANRNSKILTRLQLKSAEHRVFVCFTGNHRVPAPFSRMSHEWQDFGKVDTAFILCKVLSKYLLVH